MPPRPPNPPLTFTTNPSLPTSYTTPFSLDPKTSQFPARLVVGAAVLHRGAAAPRILLLQRSLDEFLPSRWELPGGSADPVLDASLTAAAARELHEETALRACHVASFLGSYSWLDAGRTWAKHSFVVEVEGGDGETPPPVKLDPQEHQDYIWAAEEEIMADLAGGRKLVWTSEDQKGDVLRAFEMARGSGSPSS